MRDYQKYANALLKKATKERIDSYRALDCFLDYLLDIFEIKNLQKFDFDFSEIFKDAKERDIDYFTLMCNWFEEVTIAMENGGYLDFFGAMYEELFKSKGKASALGQYYTPDPICEIMARIVHDDGFTTGMDCACGSGRTLLAAHAEAGKNKFHYYDCADIDITSVKMCTLNMMIHGMIGEVRQQDTLLLPPPSVTYLINEIRYPYPTPYYSIRRILPGEPEPRMRAMRRKKEQPRPQPEPVKTEPQPRKEPIQLELFNL